MPTSIARPCTANGATSFSSGNPISTRNREPVASRTVARLFLAGMLALLGLAGCGAGGEADEPTSTAPSAAPSTAPSTQSGALSPDTTPPTVSATSPANAATGVGVNASVSATFSEAMTRSTLTGSSIRLAVRGGAAVNGTVVVSGNTAMFVPSSNLAASTQYAVTITTAARDASGNALAASYTWNFTTGTAPDTTLPTVSSTSPADAANGVATNSSVSATFSEAMTNSTLTTSSFTLARATGGAAVSGTVNVNGNTATFTPSSALAASTRYIATIAANVTDASGNALGRDHTWDFTTAAAPDATRPTVSATSPANGATGVATNASISATFSEAMTNATLTTASFRLANAGGTPVTGTVNVNGNTATFTPTVALTGGSQYAATITTAAKDAAGNALAASRNWTFTTGVTPDTTPPSTPTGLGASAASASRINLSWSASTDNIAVTGYRIYRGGTLLATVGAVITYQDTGLTASRSYSYTVAAIDAAGNVSGQSVAASATTLVTPPSTGTATLAWSAVSGPNLGGYRVYYGTASGNYLQPFGQGINVGTATSYTITGLSSGNTYYFAVTAYDTSGNESNYSGEASKSLP
jgi:hypothetical protein